MIHPHVNEKLKMNSLNEKNGQRPQSAHSSPPKGKDGLLDKNYVKEDLRQALEESRLATEKLVREGRIRPVKKL